MLSESQVKAAAYHWRPDWVEGDGWLEMSLMEGEQEAWLEVATPGGRIREVGSVGLTAEQCEELASHLMQVAGRLRGMSENDMLAESAAQDHFQESR